LNEVNKHARKENNIFFHSSLIIVFSRPHCDQLLAVGATTGIMLWYVDPTTPCSR